MQPNNEERVAYMRKYVFAGWLRRLHESITADNPHRKIALILDNAPGHLIVADSEFLTQIPNIEIITLPKNSTSVTQPLDAGIIAVFKSYYLDFLAISTMAHRHKLHTGTLTSRTNGTTPRRQSNNIPNKDAWKHIVQAWNLLKKSSIRNCFRHVPIFNERQKNALSLPIHDNDVMAALRNIRLNIHQINQRAAVPMPKEPLDLDTIDDDLSPAVLSYESVIHWSSHAEPEDLMAFKSIPKPKTFDPICQIEIPPPNVYYEPSPFNVTSSGQPVPGDSELISYRDTPQLHYGRLSREMGGTTFTLERIEEMRGNRVFVRFFEREATPLEVTTMSENFISSDDDQDADFHIVLPEDVPTTNHPRRLGRHLGRNTRRVDNLIYDIPSSPSVVSECTEDYEVIDQNMEDVEVKETKPPEEARQDANVFAAAAEALDTSFGSPTTHDMVREYLDLSYDRTIKKEEHYYYDYYKQRKDAIDRLAIEKEKIYNRFPQD
jgi:hypothetical protein